MPPMPPPNIMLKMSIGELNPPENMKDVKILFDINCHDQDHCQIIRMVWNYLQCIYLLRLYLLLVESLPRLPDVELDVTKKKLMLGGIGITRQIVAEIDFTTGNDDDFKPGHRFLSSLGPTKPHKPDSRIL